MEMGEFSEYWAVDFEFRHNDGALPLAVVCMVARELRSGRTLLVWQDELYSLTRPPFDIGPKSCFIAYNVVAELSCFLHLGWSFPQNVIDLYPEYLNISNGLRDFRKGNLISAMKFFGLDTISITEKKEMIDLIISRTSYTDVEKQKILEYCKSDVDALARLYPKIAAHCFFNMRFALNRGRYMKAVARIEANGIPLDLEMLARINTHWDEIKSDLIAEKDARFGVYDEEGKFSYARLERCLDRLGIEWPYRTKKGKQLKLDDETFELMAKRHPVLPELRQLRRTLSELKLNKIQVGPDGRNRCSLFPFTTLTSRNAPSTTRFIYGPAKWVRWMIKPTQGMALAYIDYKQQEVGIAAGLSGDEAMMDAYRDGDCYMSFAKKAGAAPPHATKESHGQVRKFFKQTFLGTQYLMSVWGLARDFESLGMPKHQAEEEAPRLLALHKKVFAKFWAWSEAVYDYATLKKMIFTRFGWRFQITKDTKERTIRNFPMQANGAEMIRLACSFATEKGVRVCAPVHDALLIEAPIEDLDAEIRSTRECMKRASEMVLQVKGFALDTEVNKVIYPNRYEDEDGEDMWNTIQRILSKLCPDSAVCERCHET
jgi:DNA polymerase I